MSESRPNSILIYSIVQNKHNSIILTHLRPQLEINLVRKKVEIENKEQVKNLQPNLLLIRYMV